MKRTGTQVSFNVITRMYINSSDLQDDLAPCIEDVKFDSGFCNGSYFIAMPIDIEVPIPNDYDAIKFCTENYKGKNDSFICMLLVNCIINLYADYESIILIKTTDYFKIDEETIIARPIYNNEN